MRELCPLEELHVPRSGWRYVCESETCQGKTRYFKPTTGVQAHFLLGRIVAVKCQTCGAHGLVEA